VPWTLLSVFCKRTKIGAEEDRLHRAKTSAAEVRPAISLITPHCCKRAHENRAAKSEVQDAPKGRGGQLEAKGVEVSKKSWTEVGQSIERQNAPNRYSVNWGRAAQIGTADSVLAFQESRERRSGTPRRKSK
jgi:hypothetical protein